MLLTNSNTNNTKSSMHVRMLNVTDEATSKQLEDVHARKNHHIITLYYRDGCPPCDKMKPEWKRACEMFKQKYNCKDNDASERTMIASVDDNGIKYLKNVFHNIEGTPTMMYISDGNMSEFNGEERNAKNFLKWFEDSLKSEIVPTTTTITRHHRRLKGGCWTMKKKSTKRGARVRRRKVKSVRRNL
jgi:hypothetical protein